VTIALSVFLAAIDEMPHDLVAVIHALAPLPVDRLSGMMFVTGKFRNASDLSESVGEIVEEPISHRIFIPE
jgi:hypothetical protein